MKQTKVFCFSSTI